MFSIPTQTIVKEEFGSAATNKTVTVTTAGVTGYTPVHLVIRIRMKGDSADVATPYIRLNGDTGSTYNSQLQTATGSTVAASRSSDTSGWLIANGITGGDSESSWAYSQILIPDAFTTNTQKCGLFVTTKPEEPSTVGMITHGTVFWDSTAAITSVTLVDASGSANNFDDETEIELSVVDENYAVTGSWTTGASGVLGSDGTWDTGDLSGSGLPGTNGSLVIIGNLKSTVDSSTDVVDMEFNNDTTSSNYWSAAMTSSGTSENTGGQNNAQVGEIGADSTAGKFGPLFVAIPEYSATEADKSYVAMSGYHTDSASFFEARHGHRDSTTAINRIAITTDGGVNFKANSGLWIYKLSASGGNLIARYEATDDSDDDYTFSSIGTDYDHLEIITYQRYDAAGWSSISGSDSYIYLGDSGGLDETDANYGWRRLKGENYSGVSASVSTSANINNGPSFSGITTSTADSGVFAAGVNTIFDYKKTDRYKAWMTLTGSGENNTDDWVARIAQGQWEDNDAITQMKGYASYAGASTVGFIQGSVVELRGINTTPLAATSDIQAVNGIALASIEAVNGITATDGEKINGVDF